MSGPRRAAGLARSLAIYYGRPDRILRLGRFYRQFIAPDDLAFDIGGHVGNRSLAMARAGARVITLEPQDLFYRFLRRTMPSRVTVLPLAAGPAAGSACLAVSSLHPTVSSLTPAFDVTMRLDDGFAHVVWDRSQHVAVTTLDALIERYGRPALVKIDVEGYECEVLAGLSWPVQVIAFEYLPAMLDVAAACIDRLLRLGAYRFNLVRGESACFASPDWLSGCDMQAVLRAMADEGRSGDIYARLGQR